MILPTLQLVVPLFFRQHGSYKAKRSRKSAMIGMAAGTVFMAFIGCFLNAYVLLPAYAKAFSMPIDALVGMGTASKWSYYEFTYICRICSSTI